jgi:hypothetical protein
VSGRVHLHLGTGGHPSLITNDPDEFLEFYAKHEGNIVSKLPSPALTRTLKHLQLARYTQQVTQVFAAEIHSQKSNRTRIDWRRYDPGHTPHYPHTLPDDIRRSCVELVRQLGLCYGAIDMVLTPDGRYVFLEINPNGQFLWIEQLTGMPISDAICDLLASGRAPEPTPT